MKKCEYCLKPIGESNKIYMAGSICIGHRVSLSQFIKYKILKFLGFNVTL